jgi:MFS family permease
MERRWWTLTAVCLCIFMLMLDITVVNVALPDIQQSLHSSFADLQWVIDAYALTLATFLLTAGVIGDMVGRQKVYAVGVTVFTVSSLLCGLATSSLMLTLGPSCSPPRWPCWPRRSRARNGGLPSASSAR